jgi:hypothetical protein
MASSLYKAHLFVATAQHDEKDDSWAATVTISWKRDGRFQFHRFTTRPNLTEEEAMAEAMTIGRLWVDQKL